MKTIVCAICKKACQRAVLKNAKCIWYLEVCADCYNEAPEWVKSHARANANTSIVG